MVHSHASKLDWWYICLHTKDNSEAQCQTIINMAIWYIRCQICFNWSISWKNIYIIIKMSSIFCGTPPTMSYLVVDFKNVYLFENNNKKKNTIYEHYFENIDWFLAWTFFIFLVSYWQQLKLISYILYFTPHYVTVATQYLISDKYSPEIANIRKHLLARGKWQMVFVMSEKCVYFLVKSFDLILFDVIYEPLSCT